MRFNRRSLLAASGLLAAPASLRAQPAFPNRPIRKGTLRKGCWRKRAAGGERKRVTAGEHRGHRRFLSDIPYVAKVSPARNQGPRFHPGVAGATISSK